jgi:predicted FMN-binding regulatory protein PaiB
MSVVPGKFSPPEEADVTRLVLEHPFAWLVTEQDGDFAATPLPLRPVLDEHGAITALLGHFARGNPHVELLRRVPRTLVLFMGPHGYISSSWFGDRTRTPTWNYATAQFVVDIEFIEDAAGTEAILRDLIGAMEQGRPGAWSLGDMGPRYQRLVSGIIAFRAHIRERRVKFKLGQDERDAEYGDIVRALGAAGECALLEWMQHYNPSRDAT